MESKRRIYIISAKGSQVGAEGNTPDIASRAVAPDGRNHGTAGKEKAPDVTTPTTTRRMGGWAMKGLMDHAVLRAMEINHQRSMPTSPWRMDGRQASSWGFPSLGKR